jgi:response regulator RpfG family c-di-GMP phosphodiesterase
VFDFDKTNKVCYPKDSGMYPKGSKKTNTSIDLYVRKPKIITPPVGVTDKILNVNSITYENYKKSNKEMKNNYNLSKATSVQKQQMEQLQSTMNSLSSQISSLTTKFDTNSQELEKQTQTNSQGIRNYVKAIKNTNTKIKDFDTNIDNILNDSDIVVLQKNYDYLFWSIIATASVLISMNIVKKN